MTLRSIVRKIYTIILVIFDIMLIIDVYVDPHYHVNATYFLFANYYIVVIGVVFATCECPRATSHKLSDIFMGPVWSSSFTYMQQRASEGSLSWHVARPGTVESTGAPVRAATRHLHSSSDNERYDNAKTGGWDAIGLTGERDEPIPLRVLVDKSGSSHV